MKTENDSQNIHDQVSKYKYLPTKKERDKQDARIKYINELSKIAKKKLTFDKYID